MPSPRRKAAPPKSPLAGRAVLVTGADGFIGSHLAERLVREGARVRALCVYNSQGSRGWLEAAPAGVRDAIEFFFADVRDPGRVLEACRGIDTVFHLAALVAIPYSYQAPESFLETNVRGTLNVLEAVRRAGCRRMVQTSTSEVYGTPATLPIRETHPLQAQSPYAASKIGADKLCEAYAASFGVPVVVLRPFNTYGPRQSARAVLPTILSQLLAGSRRVKLGSLAPRRDLTHVDDTVDGFVRMATAPLEPGETIHLGAGSSVSIGELFALCCEVVGVRAVPVTDRQRVRPDKSEVQVLESDPARAAARLGWAAKVGLREGLAATATWIAANPDRFVPGEYAR